MKNLFNKLKLHFYLKTKWLCLKKKFKKKNLSSSFINSKILPFIIGIIYEKMYIKNSEIKFPLKCILEHDNIIRVIKIEKTSTIL